MPTPAPMLQIKSSVLERRLCALIASLLIRDGEWCECQPVPDTDQARLIYFDRLQVRVEAEAAAYEKQIESLSQPSGYQPALQYPPPKCRECQAKLWMPQPECEVCGTRMFIKNGRCSSHPRKSS